MSLNQELPSRPTTPGSPSSLRDATATIDDLTLALSDFSRVHSPEPPDLTTCCCRKEDCEDGVDVNLLTEVGGEIGVDNFHLSDTLEDGLVSGGVVTRI